MRCTKDFNLYMKPNTDVWTLGYIWYTGASLHWKKRKTLNNQPTANEPVIMIANNNNSRMLVSNPVNYR